MGWCSGTDIFDKVAAFALKSNASDIEKYDVLYALAEALEDNDWDCQSDSDYWDHPIIQGIFKVLHSDWEWD